MGASTPLSHHNYRLLLNIHCLLLIYQFGSPRGKRCRNLWRGGAFPLKTDPLLLGVRCWKLDVLFTVPNPSGRFASQKRLLRRSFLAPRKTTPFIQYHPINKSSHFLLFSFSLGLIVRIALGEASTGSATVGCRNLWRAWRSPAKDKSFKRAFDMNVRLLYFVLRLIWFWFNGLLRRFASRNDDSPYKGRGYCGFALSFRVAAFATMTSVSKAV